MKSKILITGANGFLGSHMWRYVCNRQGSPNVFAVDITDGAKNEFFQKIDLTCQASVQQLLKDFQPDIIFHCAGGRMSDSEASRLANLGTTECLCQALHENGLIRTRLIIPGSAAEYGLPPKNIRKISETLSPKPQADYGKIKWEQSKAALGWTKKGLQVIVGRVFNILGSHTPGTLAAGRFAQQIALMELRGKTGVLQTYDLSGKRDFLDIEDVCSALWALGKKGKSGEVYNICSGAATRISDLLEVMIQFSKMTDVTIDEQSSASHSFNVIGSAVKIRKDTGWAVSVPLEKSVRQTLQSWRKKVRS